jgi:hypothetical protein
MPGITEILGTGQPRQPSPSNGNTHDDDDQATLSFYLQTVTIAQAAGREERISRARVSRRDPIPDRIREKN